MIISSMMPINDLVRCTLALHRQTNVVNRESSMRLVVRKLRAMNSKELAEFCLQIKESYAPQDGTTAILILSFVLEHALKHQDG